MEAQGLIEHPPVAGGDHAGMIAGVGLRGRGLDGGVAGVLDVLQLGLNGAVLPVPAVEDDRVLRVVGGRLYDGIAGGVGESQGVIVVDDEIEGHFHAAGN